MPNSPAKKSPYPIYVLLRYGLIQPMSHTNLLNLLCSSIDIDSSGNQLCRVADRECQK